MYKSAYNKKCYGVYFYYQDEFAGANVSFKEENRGKLPGFDNLLFEAILLAKYGGKNNVLKVSFDNRQEQYLTVEFPYLFFDSNKRIWKKAKNKAIPEAFKTECIRQKIGWD